TDTALHLIHPLGFSTEDKMVRRAGLDYWKQVSIQEHASIDDLYAMYPTGTYYYIENFGSGHYTEFDYSNIDGEIFFVFGRETDGIPKSLLEGKENRCLRIPMNDKVRSLNLANTAAII